jgi:hypothetical protein
MRYRRDQGRRRNGGASFIHEPRRGRSRLCPVHHAPGGAEGDEGEQRHVPGPLDGDAQVALVLGANPGLAGGLHLGAVGDEAAQALHVLVVNQGYVLGAEDAVAPPGWEPAAPPRASPGAAGPGRTAGAGGPGPAGTAAESGWTAGSGGAEAGAGAAGTGAKPGWPVWSGRPSREGRARRLTGLGCGRTGSSTGGCAWLGRRRRRGRRGWRAGRYGYFWSGHTGKMPPDYLTVAMSANERGLPPGKGRDRPNTKV